MESQDEKIRIARLQRLGFVIKPRERVSELRTWLTTPRLKFFRHALVKGRKEIWTKHFSRVRGIVRAHCSSGTVTTNMIHGFFECENFNMIITLSCIHITRTTTHYHIVSTRTPPPTLEHRYGLVEFLKNVF